MKKVKQMYGEYSKPKKASIDIGMPDSVEKTFSVMAGGTFEGNVPPEMRSKIEDCLRVLGIESNDDNQKTVANIINFQENENNVQRTKTIKKINRDEQEASPGPLKSETEKEEKEKVESRKGPVVTKGSDEMIYSQLQNLCYNGDPWNFFTKVQKRNIYLIILCFVYTVLNMSNK